MRRQRVLGPSDSRAPLRRTAHGLTPAEQADAAGRPGRRLRHLRPAGRAPADRPRPSPLPRQGGLPALRPRRALSAMQHGPRDASATTSSRGSSRTSVPMSLAADLAAALDPAVLFEDAFGVDGPRLAARLPARHRQRRRPQGSPGAAPPRLPPPSPSTARPTGPTPTSSSSARPSSSPARSWARRASVCATSALGSRRTRPRCCACPTAAGSSACPARRAACAAGRRACSSSTRPPTSCPRRGSPRAPSSPRVAASSCRARRPSRWATSTSSPPRLPRAGRGSPSGPTRCPPSARSSWPPSARAMGEADFATEYECQFGQAGASLFTAERLADLILPEGAPA